MNTHIKEMVNHKNRERKRLIHVLTYKTVTDEIKIVPLF